MYSHLKEKDTISKNMYLFLVILNNKCLIDTSIKGVSNLVKQEIENSGLIDFERIFTNIKKRLNDYRDQNKLRKRILHAIKVLEGAGVI